MDHDRLRELISAYIDREMDQETSRLVAEHLEVCPECRRLHEDMCKLEEVMSNMKIKEPSKEAWQLYWTSVYNRLERRIGWALLSIGAIIILFFGGYQFVKDFIHDPNTPTIMKVGILTGLGGVAVLLVSLIRERIFVSKRERYREIEK